MHGKGGTLQVVNQSSPSILAGGGGGGERRRVLPFNRLMGLHFHHWIDYNGVIFTIELIQWGCTFSDLWG